MTRLGMPSECAGLVACTHQNCWTTAHWARIGPCGRTPYSPKTPGGNLETRFVGVSRPRLAVPPASSKTNLPMI
eukprot:1361760-Lingulodinium_polyedra.AAC.1